MIAPNQQDLLTVIYNINKDNEIKTVLVLVMVGGKEIMTCKSLTPNQSWQEKTRWFALGIWKRLMLHLAEPHHPVSLAARWFLQDVGRSSSEIPDSTAYHRVWAHLVKVLGERWPSSKLICDADENMSVRVDITAYQCVAHLKGLDTLVSSQFK